MGPRTKSALTRVFRALKRTGVLPALMAVLIVLVSFAAPSPAQAAYENVQLDTVGNLGRITLWAVGSQQGQVVWDKYDADTSERKLWLQTGTTKIELDTMPCTGVWTQYYESVQLKNGFVVWVKRNTTNNQKTLMLYDGTQTRPPLDSVTGASTSIYSVQLAPDGQVAWLRTNGTTRELWLWNGTTVVKPLGANVSHSEGSMSLLPGFENGRVFWTQQANSTATRFLYKFDAAGTGQLDSIGSAGFLSGAASAGQALWRRYDGSNTYLLKFYDGFTTETLDTVTAGWGYNLRLDAGVAAWTKYLNATSEDQLWFLDTTTEAPKAQLDHISNGWMTLVDIDAGRVLWQKRDEAEAISKLRLYDGTDTIDIRTTSGWFQDIYHNSGQVVWSEWEPSGYSLWFYNGEDPDPVLLDSIDDGYIATMEPADGLASWLKYDYSGSATVYSLWLYDGVSKTQLDLLEYPDYFTSWILGPGHLAWAKLHGNWRLMLSNQPPQQPTNVSPAEGTGVPLTPTLTADAYSDPEGDTHIASQWQITPTAGDYSETVRAWDSGETAPPEISIAVPSGNLSDETSYYWRVRYQDYWGAWSPWSTETSFTTNRAPHQPTNVSPTDGAAVSLTPLLQSSAFSDPDEGNTQNAARWRVTATSGNYSAGPLVYDSGPDTTNLTSITVPAGELTGGNTYYWQVRHQDNFGFWSDWSDQTSFFTDDVPPAVTITPLSPDPTNITTPTLTGTATDTLSAITSVEYRVGEGSWTSATFTADESDPKTGTYTFTTAELADGSHTVEVRARDAAGNWTTSTDYASDAFTVDTTPSTITPVETLVKTNDKTPRFTGTVSDDSSPVTSVEYRINGGSWYTVAVTPDATDPNAGSYSFNTFLLPGKHTVEIRSVDAAGNTSTPAEVFVDVGAGGLPIWAIIIIVLAVLGIAGGGTYLIMKKRSKDGEILPRKTEAEGSS